MLQPRVPEPREEPVRDVRADGVPGRRDGADGLAEGLGREERRGKLFRRGSGRDCKSFAFGLGWFDSITSHHWKRAITGSRPGC